MQHVQLLTQMYILAAGNTQDYREVQSHSKVLLVKHIKLHVMFLVKTYPREGGEGHLKSSVFLSLTLLYIIYQFENKNSVLLYLWIYKRFLTYGTVYQYYYYVMIYDFF